MKRVFGSILVALMLLNSFSADAQTKDKNKKTNKEATMSNNDSLSYALGVSIGNNLKQAGVVELNTTILGEAMKAALAGQPVSMNDEQCNMIIQQELGKLAEAKSAEARKGGEEFLEKNKTNPGVQVTASGLQLMKEGGKTTFYIPQQLAYGAQDMGTIPAFSTLIFEVELIKVNKMD